MTSSLSLSETVHMATFGLGFPGSGYLYPRCLSHWDHGSEVSTGFDVTHFTVGHSVRQVFDAFMYFTKHQEISVSEELDVLTIREDDDDFDGVKSGQCRFLATIPGGLEVESNQAMFARLVEPADGQPGYAVATMDFVDKDDRYAYRPETRGRKQVTAALLLKAVVTATGETAVALCRWGYLRFHAPLRSMTETETTAVWSTVMTNGGLMGRVMRERLAMRRPDLCPKE